MLSEWLSPTSLTEFRRTVLRQRAWARPGAAVAAARLCDWQTLDAVLAAVPPPDVLVVARGALHASPAPRSLTALRSLMQRGIGVCVRRSERQHERLRVLPHALAKELVGQVHIQLFATPGATHGFSWHYDCEEVFIVQTAGIKDYYFRQNTVEPRLHPGKAPDFSRVKAETAPLQTARLLAGDCLYIPARWWHMAHCVEDSLSMSLGVQQPAM